MEETWYKLLPEHDVNYEEPLLDEKLESEETATPETNFQRFLPSIKNTIVIFYVVVSLPILVSTVWNLRAQIYCQYPSNHTKISNSPLIIIVAPVNPLIKYERQPLHEEHEDLVHKGYVGNPEDTEENWKRLLERMPFFWRRTFIAFLQLLLINASHELQSHRRRATQIKHRDR